jgi:hypothetical protein
MSAPFDLDKFVRVIGLVGSAHDGEALTGARTAERLLRDGGLTWDELLKPPMPNCVSRSTPPGSFSSRMSNSAPSSSAGVIALLPWPLGAMGLVGVGAGIIASKHSGLSTCTSAASSDSMTSRRAFSRQ